MADDVVIRAEGLGKKYLIGHQSADRNATLRDALVRGAGNFARMGKAMLRGGQIVAGDEVEEFWALRDVDFEIRRGDVVGVIGRNGAGKSTLLKVLSRITEPSEGRVTINGRVASLLEVGTGFHPELSGRENIFLNGAILGMSRAEIRRKFDEIVAFAEVEKFLDTPVKRYSSGMYVRLAFSVAAHLEPEILIVDEVLAVGDAEFQKKCLGKVKDISSSGRTVIFVSHSMQTVQTLCDKGIYLSGGRLEFYGDTHACIERYLSPATDRKHLAEFPASPDRFDAIIEPEYINITDRMAIVPVQVYSPEALTDIAFELHLSDESGMPALFCNSGTVNALNRHDIEQGFSTWHLEFDHSRLASGGYNAKLQLVSPGKQIFCAKEYPRMISLWQSQEAGRLRFMQGWGNGSVESDLQAVRQD